MSVISNWQAVPRRFEILFNTIASAGPSGRSFEELRRLVTAATPKESTLFPNAFAEAIRVNLLQRQDDRVTIPGREGAKWTPSRIAQEFRRRIEEALVPDAGDTDAVGRADDLPLSLAWLGLQSPWRPLLSTEEPAGLLEQQIGDDELRGRFSISTLDSFRNFVYWARFLGFCSYLKTSADGFRVVPDATAALRRVLDDVLPEGPPVAASEFVRRVGGALKVIDGGSYRAQLLECWAGKKPEKAHLSGPLSLALRRLSAAGAVDIVELSDADVWIQDDPVEPSIFTHLRRR